MNMMGMQQGGGGAPLKVEPLVELTSLGISQNYIRFGFENVLF